MTSSHQKVMDSFEVAQACIENCLRAVEQKDKVALKAYTQALKVEIEGLSSLLQPLLQQVDTDLASKAFKQL